MLQNIKSPADIKALTTKQLEALAAEIREKIIDTVSKNGGHLGSNLGVVEATIMIHKLFDVPKDKLIFDVGHQCYTHKILTGRYESFDSLRSYGGISGFTNRFESKYDTLTAGHSGSSISAALGIATADKLAEKDNYTVAVVGDGSFTNGMIYEALNNCNNKNIKLIIILNDNEMSISQNVGSLAKYLSKIRTSGKYYNLKRSFQMVFKKIPFIGNATICFVRHIKNGFKRIFYKQPFFEALGVKYLGPVDGNDLEKLHITLNEAKKSGKCCLVHLMTKKGYGYKYAELQPENYHSVSAFDVEYGTKPATNDNFSSKFGEFITEKAQTDTKICALTSAMCDGTGLKEFSKSFPDRFFDVGIAEEHEIAFAGGLAVSGNKPVCALYSTFAQRTYDQLIHDVSLQKLHIVLALDRAGLVSGDGETHQGIFDCAFISDIPNTEIYSPETYEELKEALELSLNSSIISVVRYPKGSQENYDRSGFYRNGNLYICNAFSKEKCDLVILTYGAITKQVYLAAKTLYENNICAKIIKLFKVHPVKDCLCELENNISGVKNIFLVEEGIKNGGIMQKLLCALLEKGSLKDNVSVVLRAIDDSFPTHGDIQSLRESYGLDSTSLTKDIEMFVNNTILS